MKKTGSLLLIVVIIFTFFSCLKENHSVRFRNNFHESINNVIAGSANLGNVGVNQVSGYQAINTGNFSISGTSASGLPLTGSGSVSGRGTHKWTITLSSASTIGIAQD